MAQPGVPSIAQLQGRVTPEPITEHGSPEERDERAGSKRRAMARLLGLPDESSEETISACFDALTQLDPPVAWAWWANTTGEVTRANTPVREAVTTLAQTAHTAILSVAAHKTRSPKLRRASS
jgi:hypothetical protein